MVSSAPGGTYEFPDLLAGSYTATIEKAGFKKVVRRNVQVEANKVAKAKIKLELGEIGTTMEVSSGADVVQTTTCDLSGTCSGRLVHQPRTVSLGRDAKDVA